MHTTHSPLTRTLQTTTNTLPATNNNRKILIAFRNRKHYLTLTASGKLTRAITTQRMITTHSVTTCNTKSVITTNNVAFCHINNSSQRAASSIIDEFLRASDETKQHSADEHDEHQHETHASTDGEPSSTYAYTPPEWEPEMIASNSTLSWCKNRARKYLPNWQENTPEWQENLPYWQRNDGTKYATDTTK